MRLTNLLVKISFKEEKIHTGKQHVENFPSHVCLVRLVELTPRNELTDADNTFETKDLVFIVRIIRIGLLASDSPRELYKTAIVSKACSYMGKDSGTRN